jgi:hypothetical protein
MQLLRQRVRIIAETAEGGTLVDAETGDTPRIARASDVQVEVLFQFKGTILTISNFSTITLQFKPAARTGGYLLEQIISGSPSIDTTITEANHAAWDDATGQHALFALTAAQTALTVASISAEYHLVLWATTTDSPARIIPVAWGKIIVEETGMGGADAATPGPPTSYTKAEVDALLAGALQQVMPAGATITLVHATSGKSVVLGVDDTGELKITTIAP